ncbi:MAG: alpha/beta hydrolase [Aerococcus sp.]|nr:alpha/beta hydrolase [Aerococcus sp.]
MTATVEALAFAEEMRRMCKENDDKRDAGLPTTLPTVKRHNNIVYGTDEKWQSLDVYLPAKGNEEPLPTIINIHGGGWVYGTKETYQFYAMSLAEMGFAIVNFNYRLPTLVEFPGELDDVNRVFHWVSTHANEFPFDLEHVFVVGDSAGGQMALQYLTIMTNDNYRKKFGYDKPSLQVRAAALNCAASFINHSDVINGAPAAYFTEEAKKKHPYWGDTEQYLTTDLPPLFLMTSNHDFIRDMTVRLDGYLLAKGIFHEFHSYGDEDHPREHVFHCNIKDSLARTCNEEEMAFFKRYLN